MITVDPEFARALCDGGDFNATACMNCGTCTGLCPHGLDILPRELFRYVVLGLKDKVLANTETIYSCLLCRMCEANCPGDVRITENVRSLRHYINRNVFKL
jgi:heterodisulfide reductase subunit C2